MLLIENASNYRETLDIVDIENESEERSRNSKQTRTNRTKLYIIISSEFAYAC